MVSLPHLMYPRLQEFSDFRMGDQFDISEPRPASAQSPSPKRRRVALACQHCRERKVRCDGGRPICGTCQRRGNPDQPCEYLVMADTAKYQTERAYLETLRAHLTDLEGTANPPELPHRTEATLPDQNINSGKPDSPAANQLPMSLNAMGAPVPVTPNATSQDQYYGQSSLVSLVHQYAHSSPSHRSAQSQSKHGLGSSQSPASLMTGPDNSSMPMDSMLSDDFSLPPRRLADWLLEVYFSNNHIFYPWLQKETFLARYESLWTSEDNNANRDLPDVGLGSPNCPQSIFSCALNAVFAIACEFSNMEPRAKRTSSMMFYERMKNLVNIDILDSGSLAYVQALLLVGIYLQCTPFPKRCWNVIGMAHRMAIGLGLQDRRQYRHMSALEQEIRWRAWCACVQMDVITSMTMGRPPITLDFSRVPLPSPVDDNYLSSNQRTQPEGIISTNQFLHENMKLIRILCEVLLKIYCNEADPSEEHSSIPGSDFKAIMEIEKALEEFESTLSVGLAWKSSRLASSNRIFRRQSNVLHARYLHLKLLLYRPTFSAYCSSAISTPEQTPSDSWSILYQQNAALRCINAACDLIHSLSEATTEDATGAWWYGVFYLISAGLVLVLTESSGANLANVTPAQLKGSWNECLETLNRMIRVHPSARDYLIALEELRLSHMSRNQRHGQNRADQPPPDSFGNDDTSQTPGRALQTNHMDFAVQDTFFDNWDTDIGNIMLPAQFLQNLDDDITLPNLF